jgi:hypothetical protein
VAPARSSVRVELLAELADLFSREAIRAKKCGDPIESDRLEELANEWQELFAKADRAEMLRALR